MNKVFHAPPPWTCHSLAFGDDYVRVRDGDGLILAEEVPIKSASLVMAAPELLQALIRVHNCINLLSDQLPLDQWPDNPVGPTGMLRQCFDAICKATAATPEVSATEEQP